MAINPRARELCDRSRAFTTVRALVLNGKTLGPGQPFDVKQVNDRRLRQLYDQRLIRMEPGPAKAPNPRQLNNTELRAFLQARGVIPRHGAKRSKLLELASGLST